MITDSNIPSIQIAHRLVDILRESGVDFDIPEESIRTMLDVTGTPVSDSGITVSATHDGNHGGAAGVDYPLQDVTVTVHIYTHIDTDADGGLCDRLSNQAMSALRSSSMVELDGWLIDGVSGWRYGSLAMSESYRVVDLTATYYLEKVQTADASESPSAQLP